MSLHGKGPSPDEALLASSEGDPRVKEYETVFILHPEVDEAGIEREIEAVRKTIVDGQGEVTGVYKWGRRKLAYPILKVNEGFYTLIRFRSEAEVLKELDRRYKLNESVLRHLTVHSSGEPNPPEYRPRERRGERRGGRHGGRGRGEGRFSDKPVVEEDDFEEEEGDGDDRAI